jgi:hypothetical protein
MQILCGIVAQELTIGVPQIGGWERGHKRAGRRKEANHLASVEKLDLIAIVRRRQPEAEIGLRRAETQRDRIVCLD